MATQTLESISTMMERPRTINRSLILSGVLALWMVGLLVRLYQLEIFEYVELLSRAQRQQQRTLEVAPERGAIYDRQMHPLAMSLAVESVYAVPSDIANKELAASLLAPLLDLDRNDLLGRLNAFKSFCWVKRKISSQEVERVLDLNLKGIYFQKEMKRFYPKGELAAPVLGYVGLDDKGLGGLEYGFKDIEGKPGRVLLAEDARRQSFQSSEWEGHAGKSLVLTLDENVQYIAEKALGQTVQKFHAAGGVAIVENPNTGEILAMAGAPSFDPNNYTDSVPLARIDRPVSMVYEPGSVFKIVTVSAALEENLTTPNEVIDCQEGSITIAGHVIHDDERFGLLTVAEVLAHSSDVGAIKLGLRLGDDRLYEYIRRFGFGARTNVDLPGEERGILRPPSAWSAISIGAVSMGQEVGVTPIQLVSAYSAIANGGILIQPRLVRDVYRGNSHDTLPPARGRRVVSEQTAATMRQMFAGVIDHGTGTTARVSGYTAGGKTGTAQKIDASGHYSKSHYIASFAGFAPADKPAIAILVTIDSPVGAKYGRDVAAPAFASIASQTLSYLNIPQDNPSSVLQVASSASARSLRQQRRSREDTRTKNSEIAEAAPSPVQTVSYDHGVPRSKSGTMLLNDGPLATVPDFSGMALRAVVEKCETLGFELKLSGSGVGVEQVPVAGAKVPPGSGIWVRFGR
ncbi:MAG TPA: penicillin-binding protein [Terriglobia bacterium]|nr:penicillin-binding protein [Terriglobia bacterium]